MSIYPATLHPVVKSEEEITALVKSVPENFVILYSSGVNFIYLVQINITL